MKKLLIVLLILGSSLLQAQDFDTLAIADTVTEFIDTTLFITEFEFYDTVNFDPSGQDDWLYSSWSDSIDVDSVWFFQFRISGTGILERRSVKVWRQENQRINHSFDSMIRERDTGGIYRQRIRSIDRVRVR